MAFIENFIANGTEFNRALNAEERDIISEFPNAQFQRIKFLGLGSVRPDHVRCQLYECLAAPVLMYNATTSKLVSTISASNSEIDLLQLIWDKCHSAQYKCVYQGHFGATYNCIGWSMGISKWLDPTEITAYVNDGDTRNIAVSKFITAKKSIYPARHVSTIAPVLHSLNAADVVEDPPQNNTVAFFFDKDGGCTHGARYVATLNGATLNRWTSKLGSFITIAHNIEDLIGDQSPYGTEVSYATTGELTKVHIDDEL